MGDFTIPRLRLHWALLLSAALLAVTAAVLLWMGRLPLCSCGYIKLWHGGRADAELSQHLADWYTYSHVLHGVIFYWLLWAIFRGQLSVGYGAEAGYMDPLLSRMCARYCKDSLIITRNEESALLLNKLGISSEIGTDTAWTASRTAPASS